MQVCKHNAGLREIPFDRYLEVLLEVEGCGTFLPLTALDVRSVISSQVLELLKPKVRSIFQLCALPTHNCVVMSKVQGQVPHT